MVPKKLVAELRKKRNKVFLVASHIHLEGDALGSELALANLLKSLGKKVIVVNEDAPPPEYSFLPNIDSIEHRKQPFDYDTAILIDCSDLSRIGKVAKLIKKDRLLINIDHHISNTNFGDINWVKPHASSASEMIYELFKRLKVKIKKRDAMLLYTGIMVDTGSFKYATTSPFTHRAASELLGYHLDVYGIYRLVNESMSFGVVQSLGKIIQTLKTDKTGRIAWLVISNQLIKKEPTLAEQTDSIVNFARSIRGVEVALLFKETRRNQEVRVNLRSRENADVNQLARVFGGGGHRMASGATLKGRLKDVIVKVVNEAQKRLT